MRKKTLLTLLLILIAIAALGGYRLRRSNTWTHYFSSEAAEYEQAKTLLSQGQVGPAAEIIVRHKDYLTKNGAQGIDWLPLVVDVIIQSGDGPRLARLYEIYPRVVGNDESKALIVAGGLIANRRTEQYQKLRDEWRTKHHNEAAWFALDGDALIVQGKKQEATALLESRTFQGPDDSLRLIRLAIYYANDNPGQSWRLLEQALAKDPKNTHIRRYRGQILETLQRPALAQREYTIAIEKSPNDPKLYDQLAQFFIRRGQVQLALDTWKKGIALPDSDMLRLHLLFWSRVGLPTQVDWTALPAISGNLTPLIEYIIALPVDQMWDDIAFEKLPNYQGYLRTQQETFWLRVTESLRLQQEDKALDLLNHSLFISQSWSPDLFRALQQILVFRHSGALTTADDPLSNADLPPVFHHSFFKELSEASKSTSALPDDLRTLISGAYGIPAAFLAAGWFEAALSFGQPSTLPQGLPEWVAYAYTQAIRWTEGPLRALHFANLQPNTDALTLIKGELMISMGNLNAGLLQLEPLVQKPSQIGMRAAYLTVLVLINDERYDEAKATCEKNPSLGQAVIGKELLARIAIAQGDTQQADQIYESIREQSIEAKKYLVKKAMAEKNFPLARQLIESLLLDFPENQEFIEQLEKINSAHTKGGL